MFDSLWPHGQAYLSFSISLSLLKCMSIVSMMSSRHLILPHPLSSCFQSFPLLGSFPMSWLFASGGQSIGASVTASVLPMNIQDWFPLKLTGLISLQSKGLSRVFSSITIPKHQFSSTQPSLWSNFHIHTWFLEKPELWLYWTFVEKVMSLLFNMLSLSYCSFQRASIF